MLAGQVKLGKRPNPRKIGVTVDLLRNSISRQQMARFRMLQPAADAVPLPMPSQEAFFLLQPVKDYSLGL